MMTRREFMATGTLLLREDSIARVLERELGAAEYLLLRVSDRSVIAQRWTAPHQPIPRASLVKPFIAIDYARTHDAFPQFNCRRGQCWLPAGHGTLGIEQAIAQSCNAYFAHLAPPDREPAFPLAIAQAYAGIADQRTTPRVHTVYTGMRLAARSGTASGTRARIAAKTGTAPCSHGPRAPGDGLLAALFPEDAPEYVLLVRRCGVTGAATAKSCAPVFRALGYQR
jgi:cell division protein FtsI/penicillin-binding protein 2